MNTNRTILIWGATGDLSRKKLLPALFELYRKREIRDTPVVCLGRKEFSKEEFLKEMDAHSLKAKDAKAYEEYTRNLYYKKIETTDSKELAAFVNKVDKTHHCKGRMLAYLALPSELFKPVLDCMDRNGLVTKKLLIAFEKPFGHDSLSAASLNREVTKRISEKQIYRVDHYVGKSLVNNILTLRFSNPLFQTIWDAKHIDNIQAVFSEDFGIGTRGEYYDSAGAIRDFIQNHALQIIALATMKKPAKYTSQMIKKEKTSILRTLEVPNKENTVIGQYESYLSEKNVKPHSKTETFVAFQTQIKKPEWKGVPIYVRTGKYLDKKCSEINIVLKRNKDQKQNIISIRLGPEQEGFAIRMHEDSPFGNHELKPITVEHCYKCEFGANTPEAYERLLTDMLAENQNLFISWEELKESWKFTDNLIKKANQTKLHQYNKGSTGPAVSNRLLSKQGREWVYVERKITI